MQRQKGYERLIMSRVPTSIWENGYEQSANKCMNRVPTSIRENGYEQSANKCINRVPTSI